MPKCEFCNGPATCDDDYDKFERKDREAKIAIGKIEQDDNKINTPTPENGLRMWQEEVNGQEITLAEIVDDGCTCSPDDGVSMVEDWDQVEMEIQTGVFPNNWSNPEFGGGTSTMKSASEIIEDNLVKDMCKRMDDEIVYRLTHNGESSPENTPAKRKPLVSPLMVPIFSTIDGHLKDYAEVYVCGDCPNSQHTGVLGHGEPGITRCRVSKVIGLYEVAIDVSQAPDPTICPFMKEEK